MYTLDEIAKIAGVSASTVSRALSNNKKISSKTIERIQAIAKELNYTPNLSARALTGKGTKLIGLIIPEIKSNYFAQVINHVESRLNAKGYALIVVTSDFDPSKAIGNLELLIGRAVDGVIYGDGFDYEGVNVSKYNQKLKNVINKRNETNDIPIVFLSSAGEDIGQECIMFDDEHGITLMVAYLAELGHKSIGFVGESLSKKARLFPFQRALAKYGIEYNENFVKTDGKERFEEGGYLRMKELIAEGELPTAIFATYDNIAIGVMKALSEEGLKVPEDISIVGFDNIRESQYLTPSLTTIFPPVMEITRRAVDLLIEKIENNESNANVKQHTAAKTILYPELVIRQSTGAPRK
ncbi:LacI family DNA-binding transcriptional regulator [Paenibacillus nasutitermitis]|uniref:HTH-type transcriptional repressor PurR n=1 Tax=Paenibacillus nasutitermitis TaxID=1652958 RepID=A0A917E191_9BACL|nr:LacI family DNA-binding transcriptional regulator [Paenibacillus nasutitermitis]GGD88729.1 HTH-type transcriptional repressor PurR [Paenibacillus nasutitermitis]